MNNIRVVLTEQQETQAYPTASMENVADKNNLNDPANYIPYYSNADYTTNAGVRTAISSISGYPTDNFTPVNNYVARVNGSANKIGPGILLKVMAGDAFNLYASSWYKTTNTPTQGPSPLGDIVTAIAGGVAQGGKFAAADLIASGALSPSVTNFLSGQPYVAAKPKAYVNWVLLDEQFQYVAGSSSSDQVGASNVFTTHIRTNLPVHVNGYLYVYVSNETNNIDVFFDNLTVTHIKGPLVEEMHYDPLGLEMAGISSSAYKNKYIANRNKYQGQEFESSFGFNMLEFEARQYDPQIGRWLVPDPANQFVSPYLAMGNNWPKYRDPDGRWLPILIGAILGGTISGMQADYHGKPFFQAAWKGAIIGAAGAGIGSGLTGIGAFSSWGYVGGGAAIGGITGAATGGLGAGLNGGNVFQGALRGGWQGFITGAVFGAIKRANVPRSSEFAVSGEDASENVIFESQEDLEDYVNNNIGNFEDISSKLSTSINLASPNYKPEGYTFQDDFMVNGRGAKVGATTTQTGGLFTRIKSQILVSPGLKGSISNGVSVTKLGLVHEFIHAYHYANITKVNFTYSERAAYSYSLAYGKMLNLSEQTLNGIRRQIGWYPQEYSWRHVYDILGKTLLGK